MSLAAKVTIDVSGAIRALNEAQRRQVPFATARALTMVGKLALADLKAEMTRVFDRPTPYTLGAFGLKPATKTDQVATIAPRVPAAGRSAWTYLAPEVLGGRRAKQGFELKLSAYAQGQFVLPGPGATLNAYGNVSMSFLKQVTAGLDASAQQGAGGARRARRARTRYAVEHAGGRPDGRAIGIYRFTAAGQQQVFSFTKTAPEYAPRFDAEGVVRRSVEHHYRSAFDAALTAALASAR